MDKPVNQREAFIHAFYTAVKRLSPKDGHTFKRQKYFKDLLDWAGTTPDSYSGGLESPRKMYDLLLTLHCKLFLCTQVTLAYENKEKAIFGVDDTTIELEFNDTEECLLHIRRKGGMDCYNTKMSFINKKELLDYLDKYVKFG